MGSQNVHSLAPCLTLMLKPIMLPGPDPSDLYVQISIPHPNLHPNLYPQFYLVLYKPLGRTSLRHKTKKPQAIIGFPDGAMFVELPVAQSPGS